MKRFKTRISISFIFLFFAVVALFAQPITALAALGGDCNPVAVDTCGLPFPSDLFRDSTSGTLDFPNAILDKRVSGIPRTGTATLKAQFADKFTPSSVFNGSTGYSPLGPVLFELPAWPRDDIPSDGNGVLRVFDMVSGEEIPMVVSLSRVANSERDLAHQKSPVVIAWPQTRFAFGHQFAAVLLKNFYDANNRLMQPTVRMKTALGFYAVYPKSNADLLKTAYAPVVSLLAAKAIDKSQVLSATYFTVKSEAEVTQPMLDMVATAKQIMPKISGLKSREEFGSAQYGGGTLLGEIQLVNFRNTDGGVYPPYKPVPDSSQEHSEFIITLPKWDQASAVPIAVRGHGLGNDKTATHAISRRNDELGVATIAIDQPNHGSRISAESPYIGTLVHNPKHMMQLLGMFVQATVDQSLVVHAATESLPAAIAKVPSAPDLDGDRIVIHGQSMGAMVGAAIGAINPELKGVYLVNGNGALMQIFSESAFWDGNTSAIIPANANGAEVTFVLAMMQHYIDIADGMNFAHYYRNPPSSTTPVRLGMQYSIGDGSVANSSSLALAELADLPLLKGDAFEPVPRLRFGTTGRSGFEEGGNGVLQTSFGLDSIDDAVDELKGFNTSFSSGQLKQLQTLLNTAKSLGIDVSKFSSIADLAAATGGVISSSAATNLDKLIDTLYQGDLAAFLTHFNTSPLYAVKANIDWYCGLLDLDFSRCEASRKIAEKNATKNDSTDDGTDENPIPDPEEVKDDIDKAIQDGKDALNDLKVSVNQGSGGGVGESESTLLALLLLLRVRWRSLRKLAIELLNKPSFRIAASAVSSSVTWGGWAFLANIARASHADSLIRAAKSGAAQAGTSFVMTFIASVLLEYLFVKLADFKYRNLVTVLAISSLSLAVMIVIHTSVNTPRILLTILPIYAVVVLYCSAYVKTLEALNKPELKLANDY